MPWIYRMALKIFIFALPLFVYLGFRLSSAIAEISINKKYPISKKAARIIVFVFILWFYLWPITLILSLVTGNVRDLFVFQPTLGWQDYLILFPAWCGLIICIEILPYFIVLDITGWIKKKRSGTRDHSWKHRLLGLKVGITLFFVIYVPFRTYFDTDRVRISNTEIAIPNLPQEFQGLRLTFFGDTHISRLTQGKKPHKVHTTLQSGEDDLIFFTGDLISNGKYFLNTAYDLVGHPKGKAGNFACMGDHDYWTAPRDIPVKMEQLGWDFLQNQHKLITYKGKRILVTGLTFVYSSRISKVQLKQLLSTAPEADLKIMMVHQPREFLVETAAQYGYNLFLGGHTHGGELVPHIFGIPVSPSKMETPFVWGLHRFKDLKVMITNGVGRTLAALRYHAPSEITKMVLKRE